MKDKIKEYLQEKGRVTVNDLAQALGRMDPRISVS